jgi:pyruvate,orthophosphate dikinase
MATTARKKKHATDGELRAATSRTDSSNVGLYLIGCGANPEADPLGAAEPSGPADIGSKAWNLLRMTRLGLRVPPSFVIGTRYCAAYAAADDGKHKHKRAKDAGSDAPSPAVGKVITSRLPAELRASWPQALARLEAASGCRLGDERQPLLVSVRSGAPVSMPGMMETLLNIGLTDATLPGLVRLTGNPRLAWDAYRRLVATFGEVVAGIPAEAFESEIALAAAGRDERDFDFAQLRDLTQRFQAIYLERAGHPFPQDPREQLERAIDAVFESWRSRRAIEYRRVNNIDEAMGTAVTVQAMVFGNAGGMSGAGVGFTRDPATGNPSLWVDFLFNAQGEDVVSGRRNAHGHDELAKSLPAVWDELKNASRMLEANFRDMQDFEFTVQDGRLHMLQTRNGKRSALAAARIALDLLEEKIITAEEALQRVAQLDEKALETRRVIASDSSETLIPLGHAASANGGVAYGEIALDETRARARSDDGHAVILVRRDAETADIAAFEAAAGLLTARGARTSHAAVVARQLGKVCLVSCGELQIDEASRRVRFGTLELKEGEVITLDGNEGLVYRGTVKVGVEKPVALLEQLARLRATADGDAEDGKADGQPGKDGRRKHHKHHRKDARDESSGRTRKTK